MPPSRGGGPRHRGPRELAARGFEPHGGAARAAAALEQDAGDAWEPEELVAGSTLLEQDRRLGANKTGATRLGFALLLKFFELNARFAVSADELSAAAVD
jgi:hypothetical protein